MTKNDEDDDRKAMAVAKASAVAPRITEALKQHLDEKRVRYKDHFMRPTDEYFRRKAEIFQIDRERINRLPELYICGLDRKTKLHPVRRFDPDIYEVEPFVHRVKTTSFDHLKNLVGVPNETYATLRKKGDDRACVKARPVEMRHLVSEKNLHFGALSAEQRIAVHNLSFNLLMGYADPKFMERPPYLTVKEYLLKLVAELPVFVGKDLLVCPDETVEFNGFSAVYFDNVVVLGNGRIVLGNHTKLHAYQIKHV